MLSPKAAAFGVEALLRTSEVLTSTGTSECNVQKKGLNSSRTKDEKKDSEIYQKHLQKQELQETCKEEKIETLQSEEVLENHASSRRCLECYSDQCSKDYSEYSKDVLYEKDHSTASTTFGEGNRLSFSLQLPHQEHMRYQLSHRYNLQSAPFSTLYLGTAETAENETKQTHQYLLSEQHQREQQQREQQQREQQQREQQQREQQRLLQKQQRLSIDNGVTVGLQHPELWDEFHRHQTEMIITKNGRRMFPVIKIRVFGLKPDSLYMIYMDMEPVDGKRYRYAYPSSTWVVAGSGDTSGSEQVYIHSDSPATGRQWMDMLIISFDKLKLTNNRSQDTKGQIFLQSMQKYKPRIWIQCLASPEKRNQEPKFTSGSDLQKHVNQKSASQFSFLETSFITVTAYQNQRITRLKINSNPFAKGFRDNYKYKETIEKHMMTSVSCGMHCQRTPYFPFSSSLSSYFFQHPFSLNHLLPLSSSHLRPAAPSLNRWSAINPSAKPSDAIIPALNPFFNTSFSQ